MSGSSFGDSMEWGSSGRSSGSRKGKRGGADKPKQPQRGLGVAQLEKIRLQSEMAEYFHPLGQPPSLIHRTGSLILMAYGERGDTRYGEFQTPVRSPNSSTIYGASNYAHPSVTLPLFEPEESTRLKGHHDRSQWTDSTSMNPDDPQDVDLELKL